MRTITLTSGHTVNQANITLIDDCLFEDLDFQNALRSAGYEVTAFGNLASAKIGTRSETPDFVIVRLPAELLTDRGGSNERGHDEPSSHSYLDIIDLRYPTNPEEPPSTAITSDVLRLQIVFEATYAARLAKLANDRSKDDPRHSYLAVALPLQTAGRLTAHAVRIQEEERRKLSLALHDDLAQLLGTIVLTIDTCLAIAPAEEHTLMKLLKSTKEHAREGFKIARDFSIELRPQILDDLGLAAALMWYADRINGDGTFQIKLEIQNLLPTLNRDQDIAIFRIVQEAVQNARRHAHVDSVVVHIETIPNELRIVIQDDGVGFDQNTLSQDVAEGIHLGLAGMYWRTELLGGHLEIDSAAGRGTSVFVTIPVRAGLA